MTQPSLHDMTSNNSQSDYDPNSMSVIQAKQLIRNYLTPVESVETRPLRESLGRILAEDILSPHNVPNHNNSAMDGYAFNAESLSPSGETNLNIVGTAFAGRPYEGNTLAIGDCVRIMTGAVIPIGADTVIAQERVKVSDDSISFSDTIKAGFNVRYAGEDLKQGQVVLGKGHFIRAADLGLVASLGIGLVKVYRKLKVAFFSTGDELSAIGETLQLGQVYDSNRYTIYGMLARMGVEIIDLGAIPDDPLALEEALTQASHQADVIITSGGVSVGEADYMKQLLKQYGEVVFWKIAMKPGRPLAYGKVGQSHYFGLPGNPVAVMVTFYQFVREAMLVLMGQNAPKPLPMLRAICTEKIRKLPGRTEFQRGILFIDDDGEWKVKTTGNQGSGILSSMSAANCFIVLPEETGNLETGSQVQVQMMDGIV